MPLITQDEIVDTLPLDGHFSVNNIPSATIQKGELLLAYEFLGEDFYDALVADRDGVGSFTTAKYQTLYDTYLKTLLSEYILLSMTTQNVLELSNKGIDETGATQLRALEKYRETLNDEVEKSKRLINNYLTKPANAAAFPEYAGNAQQTTKKQYPPTFGGFVVPTSDNTKTPNQWNL